MLNNSRRWSKIRKEPNGGKSGENQKNPLTPKYQTKYHRMLSPSKKQKQ